MSNLNGQTLARMNAFNSLKTELTSTPVLTYPNMNKPFILSTDASGESISHILSQNDEKGMEHPIAYMGRTLRPLERKYSISERECLHIFLSINILL